MARAVYSAGIHLADDRKEWLQLMMSMAGGGKRLLDSFLLLASMAGRKFKERENRREFRKAMRKSCDAGLKFFIDRCKEKGISPNDYLAPAALSDSYQSRSNWRQNNQTKIFSKKTKKKNKESRKGPSVSEIVNWKRENRET